MTVLDLYFLAVEGPVVDLVAFDGLLQVRWSLADEEVVDEGL